MEHIGDRLVWTLQQPRPCDRDILRISESETSLATAT